LAKGARRNREIQAPQPLPQILSADADGACGLGHLPVVSGELLQQILSLTLFEAVAKSTKWTFLLQTPNHRAFFLIVGPRAAQ
jgi:hypothetical protein